MLIQTPGQRAAQKHPLLVVLGKTEEKLRLEENSAVLNHKIQTNSIPLLCQENMANSVTLTLIVTPKLNKTTNINHDTTSNRRQSSVNEPAIRSSWQSPFIPGWRAARRQVCGASWEPAPSMGGLRQSSPQQPLLRAGAFSAQCLELANSWERAQEWLPSEPA